MNHPDFRIGGKIFATLGPGEIWGMVKLTPEQQTHFVTKKPKIFSPVEGGWGRQGATSIRLPAATTAIVREALAVAWRNRAPKQALRAQLRSRPAQHA